MNIESMYSITIDENHMDIIEKILYYYSKQSDDHNISFLLYSVPNIYNSLKHGSNKVPLLLPEIKFILTYQGKKISVRIEKTHFEPKLERGVIYHMYKLILSCDHLDLLKDFILEIVEFEYDIKEQKLLKYVWKNNCWKIVSSIDKRPVDTLFLPDNKKNNILQNIEKFYKPHPLLDQLGLHNKKILLFHGKPGTGKTSFSKAIASHFNKNLAIIKNITDLNINDFDDIVMDLPNNCIILIEDIDPIFDNSKENQSRMIDILNFLDGVHDYNKVLIILTSNICDINKITNNAFKRRIDIFYEFNYMQISEICKMYEKFFGNNDYDSFRNQLPNHITPSALEKYFIYCLYNDIVPPKKIELLNLYSNVIAEKNDRSYYI